MNLLALVVWLKNRARLVVMTQYLRATRSAGAGLRPVSRLAILGCVALITSAESICPASDNPSQQLPVLTTARQVHDLSPYQASFGYPVRLRGVVTFYDAYQEGHRALFIADSTGEVFIAPGSALLLPLHAGSVVEVVGETDPGGFSPIVSHSTIRILPESQALPTAPEVTVPQLLSGGKDSDWVALKGVVHAVEFDGMHVVLTVATPDGTLSATTDKEDGANYSALIDSDIVIQGINAPLVNARRQLTGVRLLFPGIKTISVTTPAPSDPFALPTLALSSLLQYSPHPSSSHRIHVRGLVTLSWPGQTVCIVDKTAGLCIQTADRTPLKEGDLIDVAGFLERKDYLPSITAAALKRVESGGSVAPIEISAANAFDMGYKHSGTVSSAAHTDISGANSFDTDRNGELVRIQGRLVGTNRGLNGSTLLLSSDGIVFPAVLPADAIKDEKQQNSSWIDGSTVAVTGVFIGKVDERQAVRQEGIARIESFQILLRSPEDVLVVNTPSWWNGERALDVLGFVLLTMIAALGWVGILRRQVHEQTAIIRRSEARFRHMAEHDGLTGLPVRNVLLERLELALDEIKRQANSLALLMVDVDNFKHINDTMGHAVGDQVLITIGTRLQESLRPTDTVARMGGDEFTVLLTGLNGPEEAQKLASMLVSKISEPMVLQGIRVEVSVSVGVATYPVGGSDVKTLLRNSDAALYQAKATGRNCYQMHSANAYISGLRPAFPQTR
jgi:diguanylate cyclase (GGDEF)-like protein